MSTDRPRPIVFVSAERAVCEHFGISPEEIAEPSTSPYICMVRGILKYVVRGLYGLSPVEVANATGDSEYTRVSDGVRKVAEAIASKDKVTCRAVQMIARKLGESHKPAEWNTLAWKRANVLEWARPCPPLGHVNSNVPIARLLIGSMEPPRGPRGIDATVARAVAKTSWYECWLAAGQVRHDFLLQPIGQGADAEQALLMFDVLVSVNAAKKAKGLEPLLLRDVLEVA